MALYGTSNFAGPHQQLSQAHLLLSIYDCTTELPHKIIYKMHGGSIGRLLKIHFQFCGFNVDALVVYITTISSLLQFACLEGQILTYRAELRLKLQDVHVGI